MESQGLLPVVKAHQGGDRAKGGRDSEAEGLLWGGWIVGTRELNVGQCPWRRARVRSKWNSGRVIPQVGMGWTCQGPLGRGSRQGFQRGRAGSPKGSLYEKGGE